MGELDGSSIDGSSLDSVCLGVFEMRGGVDRLDKWLTMLSWQRGSELI
jgi:hypothetical protein